MVTKKKQQKTQDYYLVGLGMLVIFMIMIFYGADIFNLLANLPIFIGEILFGPSAGLTSSQQQAYFQSQCPQQTNSSGWHNLSNCNVNLFPPNAPEKCYVPTITSTGEVGVLIENCS